MSDKGIAVTLEMSLQPEHADALCALLPARLHYASKFPGFRNIEMLRQA